MRNRVAQWSAGDLKYPLERTVQIEDQKEGTGNRYRTDEQGSNNDWVGRPIDQS
jgi:hypothetical protein